MDRNEIYTGKARLVNRGNGIVLRCATKGELAELLALLRALFPHGGRMKDSWEGLRHEVRYRRQRPPLRGLRHEDADGAFRVSRYPPEFHFRRQAARGRPRSMAADPFDPRRREPYVNSDGRRFQILGSGLVASERAHAAAGSSGRAGAGAAHPGGADERDGMYRRRNPGFR